MDTAAFVGIYCQMGRQSVLKEWFGLLATVGIWASEICGLRRLSVPQPTEPCRAGGASLSVYSFATYNSVISEREIEPMSWLGCVTASSALTSP